MGMMVSKHGSAWKLEGGHNQIWDMGIHWHKKIMICTTFLIHALQVHWMKIHTNRLSRKKQPLKTMQSLQTMQAAAIKMALLLQLVRKVPTRTAANESVITRRQSMQVLKLLYIAVVC